ncbi:MAG: DNA cytosine methyltransferase [Shewanella sp.]|uniref:DNA cytosine methyltransferase n=1 Tax=Shewanella sp. TaxID=50422 RepID=UPI003F3627BD
MKSLEIFSGTGGLAKGLELAGFEHAAFVEFNKNACASLRKNFNSEAVFEGDIADFNLNNISGVDIVAGGPPCQPFSLGGKHKSHNDNRDMFPYAINCIEHLKPKAFFFENVKGILRPSFSKYFEYILLRLSYTELKINNGESWEQHLIRLQHVKDVEYKKENYHVTFKLINAADYGIPQKRERVLIVGFRSDLNINWHFPEPTHSEDRLSWDKYVTGKYWTRHNTPNQKNDLIANQMKEKYGIFPPEKLPWLTVRDALIDVPDPNTLHQIPDHVFKDGAKIYPGHTGSMIDEPAKTIKAGSHGVPGGENMIRYDDDSVRYLTTYEAKLIQTFPKEFSVTGSWGEAMKQIGNAVPVKLAEVIGKELIVKLKEA